MCHGGVGSILVMFDVLDCNILYTCFGGSPAGEADKIGFKKKPDEHKSHVG
jgi:hypothetical protein